MTAEEIEPAARHRTLIGRALTAGCPDDEFEAAVLRVLGLPADDPQRAWLAANLIIAYIPRPLDPGLRLARHVDALLEAAELHPPAVANWPRTRSIAQANSLLYAAVYGPVAELATVQARAARVAEQTGDARIGALIETVQLAIGFRRFTEQGNESMLQRLPEMASGLGAALGDHPLVAQLRQMLVHSTEAIAAHQRGDTAAALRRLDQSQEAVSKLPAEFPMLDMINQAFTPAALMLRYLDENGAPRQAAATDEELSVLAALDNLPGVSPVLGGITAGMGYLGFGTETDLTRIDKGIAQLRTVLPQMTPTDPLRPFGISSLALALYRRSELSGTTEGLAEARQLLEQARALMGGPEHPQWSLVNDMLSGIRQRTGDNVGVSESGLSAQRGYAWRALLEADAAGGRVAVRHAAQDAVDLARRAITVGDPADALQALDFGRGLMLFAATELHRIPARLRAAGRADLASLWAQDGPPSDELRRQVLDVLTTSDGDLFDPPTLPEIQSALALLQADALAYLVPGPPPHGGLAVMAPAVGPPAFMALPYLNLEDAADLERYLSLLSARDSLRPQRDLEHGDGLQFAQRLDALCGWAWRVAMGPLLESYVPRLSADPDGRVPRIVLIPMGDLARVPWHAARRKDGVYAVQLAAISQAVSARLLCDNAVLAPATLGSTGLVVADPDTGTRAAPLPSARMEAYAVRRAFYRGARYLGRLPDGRPSSSGAGTADEVRAWLGSASPAAGAMLHLACHGFFKPEPEPLAHLLLAGDNSGDGAGELSVEELVDLLAAAPARAIALVVLAACNTGRAVSGYDEAYSLGTGFLAGGVRSVLSTQWSVPDVATSWLMFLFHHYLRTEGLPPWQALRQAQMWMLDPARVPPPGMPAELVPGPGDDPAAILNWAGFVHYGQ